MEFEARAEKRFDFLKPPDIIGKAVSESSEALGGKPSPLPKLN